jgi:hypothetical protein
VPNVPTCLEPIESRPAAAPPAAVHPLGSRAKVLLTGVFGPYARDDEYGSRALNPMELYHNQVTRVQGPFSLRMFHRSWGLMLIQDNIRAPCTLLDFPTLDRFIRYLRNQTTAVVKRNPTMKQNTASRRAYGRAGAKLGFYIHLTAYVAVNLGLVAVNFGTTPQYLWFQWPLLGWAIGLFAHWFAVYVGPKLMRHLVKRELEKDRRDR